jgi:hypothetical protein
MLKDKIVALLAEADNSVLEADNSVLNEFFDCEFQVEPSAWDSEEIIEFRNVLLNAGITFEQVDRYGGEDQGSDYWSVYSFTDGMQVVFIQFQGWYASYEGSTYEEFFEVVPVEKTITVFEKK